MIRQWDDKAMRWYRQWDDKAMRWYRQWDDTDNEMIQAMRW